MLCCHKLWCLCSIPAVLHSRLLLSLVFHVSSLAVEVKCVNFKTVCKKAEIFDLVRSNHMFVAVWLACGIDH